MELNSADKGKSITMIWADFETTGLNHGVDVPLEVGFILTDNEGNEIDAASSLVLHHRWERMMEAAPDRVKKMHEESGLCAELLHVMQTVPNFYHTHSVHLVDRILYKWIKSYGLEDGVFPLAGSTINFDREVMRYYFPKLFDFFHYRNEDVSSLKQFCKRLNPRLYEKLPKNPDKKHRVLDDIRASIQEYRFYKENFLFVED